MGRKDKKLVWDIEKTTPDILLEWDLPLPGTEIICGFLGFSSFFCVCVRNSSTVSSEPRRIPRTWSRMQEQAAEVI